MTSTSRIFPATANSVDKAKDLLRQGKLVAFPTETVYGLGGDATNDRAVAAIYEAKGRPTFNPLIIHVHKASSLDKIIVWNEKAKKLADKFWPGPLTLILPRTPECPVSLLASAGLETLAVRIPAHPVALELLRAVDLPIAAPSANASGKLSPTTPEHVADSLGENINMILDGGKTTVGIESTVLDLTSPLPTILRPGGITKEQLAEIIGEVTDRAEDEKIKGPGMLTSHYAPNLPLRLNATSATDNEALLCFGPADHVKGGKIRLNLSNSSDLGEAAANLFNMLRQLDQMHYAAIAVMPIPDIGIGIAINDRLKRAAAPR